MVGKELGQSKTDYKDSAGIVYCFFLSPKTNYCIVVIEIGVLSEKITFNDCDQNIARVGFKDFFGLEKGKTVRNMSKLNWKRELYGVKLPHRIIGCENCREERKCRFCIIDPKMNCFECELCRPCDKCLERRTQIKY